jgi:hypothetical protein
MAKATREVKTGRMPKVKKEFQSPFGPKDSKDRVYRRELMK